MNEEKLKNIINLFLSYLEVEHCIKMTASDKKTMLKSIKSILNGDPRIKLEDLYEKDLAAEQRIKDLDNHIKLLYLRIGQLENNKQGTLPPMGPIMC